MAGLLGDQVRITSDQTSVTFDLENDEIFYSTGYKVIQNFPNGSLIRAMMSHLNGNIRLVYDVSEYAPLTKEILAMTPADFKSFVLGLIGLTDSIKSNGFIEGENVLIDKDYIYLNPITSEIHLIYAPIKRNLSTAQLDSLEKHTIELVRELLDNYSSVQGESTKDLHGYVFGPDCNMEGLRNVILGRMTGGSEFVTGSLQQSTQSAPDSLILERIGGSQSLVLHISGSANVIGRDNTVSNVLIPDNSVSKKHCMISKEESGWILEDLQSSNHTWIGYDANPLIPFQKYPIKAGDQIKIARFVFLVKSGMGD